MEIIFFHSKIEKLIKEFDLYKNIDISLIKSKSEKTLSNFNKKSKKLELKLVNKSKLIHELSHVINSSNEELIQNNFGSDIANSYSFSQIYKENKIFRTELVLNKHLGLANFSKIKSVLLIRKQIKQTLSDFSIEKYRILMNEVKTVFYTPISQKEIDLTIEKFKEKLFFLESLK